MRHVYGGMIYQGWQAAVPALPGFTDRFLQARLAAADVRAHITPAGAMPLHQREHPPPLPPDLLHPFLA